ncbi:MAG: tRNA (adenine-N1)-methyltransferase [Actinomycetaceae bacterium]|nr:tRNA (adenine-N1)-methyltransferase [Actinomycetaceae bacterium]
MSSMEYETPRTAGRSFGQAQRRGPLKRGDFVQITDPKGRLHTVTLEPGQVFQCSRGRIPHDALIGSPASVTVKDGDKQFQIVRPLLADYVMSMPRGAAIIYPKDAAQIVTFGDIFPGARVLEAGVGSGALSLFLLSAIGTTGELISIERRDDFAAIAQGNVDLWFGGRHPAWSVRIGEFNDAAQARRAESIDRVVLDMLTPWECLDSVARVLSPGGVLTIYVATVTQLSRVREEIVSRDRFTPPQVWESFIRPWHLEGLAVRPQHRMVAHTGFILTTRTLATGHEPQQRVSRPAKAAENLRGQWDDENQWGDDPQLNRAISAKKVRRSVRDVVEKSKNLLKDSERTAAEQDAQEDNVEF